MDQKLDLKKKTLIAWARILWKDGFIDSKRCSAMIQKIEALAK